LARLFAGGSDGRSPRRRWTDRIIGITVGVLLGLGVLVYFVFVHSEGTIDAPKISGTESGKSSSEVPGESPPAHPGSPEQKPATGESGTTETESKNNPKPIPVVKVIGGAPPTGSGPKQLHFKKGEKVRFEIETNEPFAFEIRGLGVSQSIESSSIISFKATKSGQFPVIASATLIGVADLLIKKR
jgi:hypothetical protein